MLEHTHPPQFHLKHSPVLILKSKRYDKLCLLIFQHCNGVKKKKQYRDQFVCILFRHMLILTDLVIHLLTGKPRPKVRVSQIFRPPLWLVFSYHSLLPFLTIRCSILFTFWYSFFLLLKILSIKGSKLAFMQSTFVKTRVQLI